VAYCLNVERVKTKQEQTGVTSRRWPRSYRLHVCYDLKSRGSGPSLLDRSAHGGVATLSYETSQGALRCVARHNRMGTCFLSRNELDRGALKPVAGFSAHGRENCGIPAGYIKPLDLAAQPPGWPNQPSRGRLAYAQHRLVLGLEILQRVGWGPRSLPKHGAMGGYPGGGWVPVELHCDSLSRGTASRARRRAVSILLRGTCRLSGVDVERARLLHQYTLHQCRPECAASCRRRITADRTIAVVQQRNRKTMRGER
jgi:hypothetical protein